MERKKRILVAPMDWGLGHAARCIPIIKALLHKNCEVFMASSGNALALLNLEFPELQSFAITGYDPVYPTEGSMLIKMASQLPWFLKTISAEHEEIEEIVQDQKIDVVISDNRYGGYSFRAKSIFITHQVNILMPDGWKWLGKKVNRFNHDQIRQFSECWVPAPFTSFIPGLVDGGANLKIRRIGYLSRLEQKKIPKKHDVLVICSGPEPQRQVFESLMVDQLQNNYNPERVSLTCSGLFDDSKNPLKALIIQGKPTSPDRVTYGNNNIAIKEFINSEGMNEAIEESELIISRSGYSTVMDLAKLGKKAIFVPTPGQTEQEYIAGELMNRGIAFYMKQQEFDLAEALKESGKYSGFINFEQEESFLTEAIESIL